MRCPSCESPMEAGGTCECGWTARAAADVGPGQLPPSAMPELVLAEVLRQWLARRNRWPEMMPDGPVNGARWWMAMQEPPAPDERPRWVRSRASGEQTVDSPYVRRVRTTLAQFLNLPLPAQRLVESFAQDAVWWRGEPMWQFERHTMPAVERFHQLREQHPAQWRRMLAAQAREQAAALRGRVVNGERHREAADAAV